MCITAVLLSHFSTGAALTIYMGRFLKNDKLGFLANPISMKFLQENNKLYIFS